MAHHITTKEYFSLADVQTRAIGLIHDTFNMMKANREYWTNDWLLMDDGLWMETEKTLFEWQDNNEVFRIHLFPKDELLYFTVLPPRVVYKEELHGHDGYLGCDFVVRLIEDDD